MRLMLPATLAAIAAAAPATAQEITPLADLRLRYEHVDQGGFSRDGNGLAFRLRAGLELESGDWSFLGEGEATVALGGAYDSGLNGKTSYPIVADPENIELNRLQLQYRGVPKTIATLGRQRINLDDQRFVGSVGWRQNEQTFDAVRLEYSGIKHVKADLTYAWSDRTIWGIDGTGARQQAIAGDNVFANVAWAGPLGIVTGFAYLVDQDEAQVQGYRLSSQTYGVRLAGSRPIGDQATLTYALSYARQADYRRNPSDYSASYRLLELGVDVSGAKLGAGFELLGADKGTPLASFQTPLATLHKFQGWADKFLTTPPNGIRDLYATAGYAWKKAAGLDTITATLTYHRFDSDRLNIHYGNEWDASLSAKRGPWSATVKLAAYDSLDFATDTRKLWVQLEWQH